MTIRDTPWSDGTPCWIDLMAVDLASARAFYSELFGWTWQVGDENTGHYSNALLRGSQVAGLGQLQMAGHPPVWTTYLASADAEAAVDSLVRAGGNVVAPAMDVMEFGRMAIVQDGARGTFGFWQAGSHLGCELTGEHGTLFWNEYLTRDYDAVKQLFAAVFGYTYEELGSADAPYSTISVDGHIVGGLGAMPAGAPTQLPPHWRVYFAVDDCDAAVDHVIQLGGSVLSPPLDMPYGRFADVADPQGAPFSVMTPAPAPAG